MCVYGFAPFFTARSREPCQPDFRDPLGASKRLIIYPLSCAHSLTHWKKREGKNARPSKCRNISLFPFFSPPAPAQQYPSRSIVKVKRKTLDVSYGSPEPASRCPCWPHYCYCCPVPYPWVLHSISRLASMLIVQGAFPPSNHRHACLRPSSNYSSSRQAKQSRKTSLGT